MYKVIAPNSISPLSTDTIQEKKKYQTEFKINVRSP